MSNNQISPLTNVTNPVPATTPQPLIYASFKRRLVAFLVDGLILMIIGYVLRISLGIEIASQISTAKTIEEFVALTNSGLAKYANFVTIALTFLYYFVFYVYFDGATPGKKLLGMKLVKADGKPLNFATVFVRFLFSYVSSFCLLLGYIWTIFDAKKQTWQDKVAGTYVVLSGAPARKGLGVVLAIISLLITWAYIGYISMYSIMLYSKNLPKNQTTYTQKELNPEVDKVIGSTNKQFALIRNAEDAGTRQNAVNALITELKDALNTYPNESQLWTQLASAYTWSNNAGSLDSAVVAIKKSIEIDTENATAYQTLGQIYVNQGKYSEAVIELKKSLRLNENSAYAHLTLADAYNNLGIAEDARAEYKMAISKFEKVNENGGYDSDILRAKKSMSTLK